MRACVRVSVLLHNKAAPTMFDRCRITLARRVAGGDEDAAMGDSSQAAGEPRAVAQLTRGRRPVVVHRVEGGEHRGVPRKDGRQRTAREGHPCWRTWSWEEEIYI